MPVNEGQVNKLLSEYDDVDEMVVLLSTKRCRLQAAREGMPVNEGQVALGLETPG